MRFSGQVGWLSIQPCSASQATSIPSPRCGLPSVATSLPITYGGQDRTQVGDLATALQAATGETVQLAFVDQGYRGDASVVAAHADGLRRAGVAKIAAVLRRHAMYLREALALLGLYRA